MVGVPSCEERNTKHSTHMSSYLMGCLAAMHLRISAESGLPWHERDQMRLGPTAVMKEALRGICADKSLRGASMLLERELLGR